LTDVSEVRTASIIRASIIIALMMEAAHTSETSVDNYFTRQYIPEDNSEQVYRKFPAEFKQRREKQRL
jgi:hypothetical protein